MGVQRVVGRPWVESSVRKFSSSRTDPDIEGTEPNHLGPVYFGLWSRFRPIQTGFFAYNLLYQYKPFVS
ncbi:uncharacterized protein LACBIDRAFT_317545 [Laccaria bicolor S238N-H82]|uniref:Predicted protein n=1 Tax=Laccaria bicolor (strain S238N-H82 / ATCC MYA-4686) TaxID=486041 RepID=B0E1X6_LACBS|nr:uncharacterized protein LACBIDRAFT_317545 [Laccaria bicolor S238N-H82]EDQ99131.1 predicted protein [Laccaria bicolor S238N-H82]|eukprot:XP_001890194.1 predicted protein [Laccaria bicolor S238N-H82]